MKVIATRPGYYGLKRRSEGEVFELEDEKHFSDADREPKGKVGPGWMRKVEANAEPEVSKKSSKPKQYVNQSVI